MGSGSIDRSSYTSGVENLKATGTTYARSAAASSSGDYSKIADILNPSMLKNGMREACYADGFNDVTPVIISIDGTGSMSMVPREIQETLPNLVEGITDSGASDHPNVLFMIHDDENSLSNAAFQMSQFEINSEKLLEALNEMIIPGQGGGNDGESYHLSFYAAARHTKIECFEKEGEKGYFFMICDEQPMFDRYDPTIRGTSVSLAKSVFGDSIEKEVTMLQSVKETAERYHIFIIRPGHTSHGKDRKITKQWQDLMEQAGVNPEHVLEIEETSNILPTMIATIARTVGTNTKNIEDILKSKGIDPAKIMASTSNITAIVNKSAATASVAIDTGATTPVDRR